MFRRGLLNESFPRPRATHTVGVWAYDYKNNGLTSEDGWREKVNYEAEWNLFINSSFVSVRVWGLGVRSVRTTFRKLIIYVFLK